MRKKRGGGTKVKGLSLRTSPQTGAAIPTEERGGGSVEAPINKSSPWIGEEMISLLNL